MIAHRFFSRLMATVVVGLGLVGSPAFAQSAFSPAVYVNDKVVTYYEIEQRALLMTLMNAPGDIRKQALEVLINERLQLGAAQIMGIQPSEEGLQAAIVDFAARANLKPEELVVALKREGVSEEALRDFLYAGISWQGVVQTRFGGNVQISEAEIDRAIASNTGVGGINVLLSEIVIPVTPQTVGEVEALAYQLSQITTQADFEAAAKKYSQSATKDDGGRLEWLSITKLPPQLRPQIMALGPNDVTAPVTLPNAVALFQLRRKAEAATRTPAYSAIDYAVLRLPGGRTEENLQTAAKISGRIDTCDDLFGEARAYPKEYMERSSVEPSKIPRDIGLELAKLDRNEISTALSRKTEAGQPLMLMVMLCGRTAKLGEEISREDIALSLRNQRLQSFARGYLEELRSDATIVIK
ncbi:periplasmic chaperone for outer membrane proteins SurA [Shimia gijangensis]|uniref:Parvulin-like PPIase n=1 Tax=Shimia gijangensis TaxID=1470563 RepID=A0A1M6HDC4_9RHOB|nr:peptidylprolyl isomerase [Shimia gijangensis]SHJ20258.1 periplasmic chaperone for outer membrane proteins SurA [Shimia gijangensis]